MWKKLFWNFKLFKLVLKNFMSFLYIIKYWEINKSILLLKFIFWKKESSLFRKRYKFIKHYFYSFLNKYRFKKKKKKKSKQLLLPFYSKKLLSFKLKKKKNRRRIIDLKRKSYYYMLENRKIMNFFLLSKKKSNKITKFLFKLNRNKGINLYKRLHFIFFFIILSSKLNYSINDLKYMIKNKFIYLNKLPIKSEMISLKKNDLIEFIFSKHYLLYLIYKKVNLNKSLRRYKWRRMKKLKYNLSNINKSRFFDSKYFKNFIFYFYKISKCIEIDYCLLKIIIIKDPIVISFNNWWKKFISLYILKLYNWRYLI